MQERAIKTRNAILEAATDMFAGRGFSGATVDEIAAAAGVNKQRIYAYFQSKQGLFNAALLQCFGEIELFSRGTIAEAERAPERLTEILLHGFMALHDRSPRFWRMISWANLEPELDLSLLDEARSRDNQAIRQIFDLAVSRGMLRDISFESYLFTLLAVSYFYHANQKTLVHTIGGRLFNREGEALLSADLCRMFRP